MTDKAETPTGINSAEFIRGVEVFGLAGTMGMPAASASSERDTIVLVPETAMRRFREHRLSFRETIEPLPSRVTHTALDRVCPLVGLSQSAGA